ncbi:putative transcriptional regulators, CopG/Arc/MetJ family [Rippkaea orientalis PCC 8801]|uniref:Putative transcriptional regulators, CopG/Arc/MetJ family n=1 Tax=Rippkaea orientalis (strain PCC 8801 / RF-1) TaxID=41431 RepID=B7K1M9_RIPO1|nr:type II toxin-antitoxin system ParD family antitoxin [Rippkaea orientalis]ACK67571.1 putative transcriptional regulators, CopG/Arc/MetJ family [Rippkaea orientalis PCC 8801]
MNIILNSEQEKFIQSQLKKGTYSNAEQIIDCALKLLQKQEADYENWVNQTTEKVKIGLEQLEQGEKVDGETVIAQLQEKLSRLRQSTIDE